MCFNLVKEYTASFLAYASSNFCPSAAFSANNVFHTPTGPTLLIVRHFREAQDDSWVGFHLLILIYIVLVFRSYDLPLLTTASQFIVSLHLW